MADNSFSAIRPWLWRITKIAAAIAVVGGIIYWARFRPIAVTSHEVANGPIVAEVMGTGTLEARLKATVSSKISGRINSVLVDQGDRVTAGQLLVTLDDVELTQQVAIAEADVETRKAAIIRLETDITRAAAVLEQATTNYNRLSGLIQQNAISRDELELGKDTYTVVGLTENMIGTGGDGVGFFTVADSQAIQFDTPGEAIRLEREARISRGKSSDIGQLQPALVERAGGPSVNLAPIARPQISAVIVKVSPGIDVDEVAETISAWGDVSVYTQSGQQDLVLRGPVEKARKQIGLFRVLLTAIAAIIMALILYTLTLDKIHSIALLKLIGAPNRVILGMILHQALLLGLFGYVIAYLLGQRLFPMFPRRVIITNEDLLQLAVIVAIISVASSMLGIWKAMRVSPNEALE